MANQFSSKDIELKNLLVAIDKDKCQLPDFQRPWVWNDDQIRALLLSVIKYYPVGVLMMLTYNPKNIRFKYRSFTGIDNQREPKCLVLDGQQRLTSLYHALYSKNPVETKDSKGNPKDVYYYLNIRAYLDGDDEESIVSIPKDKTIKGPFGKEIIKDLRTQEDEMRELMFPLNRLLDSDVANWFFDKYWDSNENRDIVRDVYQTLVLGMINYKIPVITLSESVPKEAVCQIFENVNTGGVALTVFELLTAIYAADDYSLSGNWTVQKEKMNNALTHDLLDGVSATDFLTSVTLVSRYLTKGATVSCKSKDILKLPLEEYQKYADKVCQGFIDASLFLEENSIYTSTNLPYSSQLIPLSAMATALEGRFKEEPVKEKIKRWYWCGVFGEMYGGANETRYVNDIIQVIDWIDNGDVPDTVQRSSFSATRLRTMTSRQSAAYKGVMALIFSNKAKDWLEGTEMNFQSFFNLNIDLHHIFPKAHCIKMGYSKEFYDCIINKTPISRRTNEVIGGWAPSKYLASLINKGVKDATLKSNVESHYVNYEYLSSDDFNNFITDRATQLLDAIVKATGKPITDRASDEVISLYGKEL
ncbi:MAG: DUF262 domain-containing protein [Candidatus Methanomethylophilaceae archaeon]|nr:DUF262 domain-containing protein [Candidatus Methanomethylophilaceae archaeon]